MLCICVQRCLHEWLREGSSVRSVEVVSSVWQDRAEELLSASQLVALVSTASSSKHGLTHNCSISISARLWDLKIFSSFPTSRSVIGSSSQPKCTDKQALGTDIQQDTAPMAAGMEQRENIFFILTPTLGHPKPTETLGVPFPWKCSRPGCTELGAWESRRCPCLWQGWDEMSFKVLPTQTSLWFYEMHTTDIIAALNGTIWE